MIILRSGNKIRPFHDKLPVPLPILSVCLRRYPEEIHPERQGDLSVFLGQCLLRREINFLIKSHLFAKGRYSPLCSIPPAKVTSGTLRSVWEVTRISANSSSDSRDTFLQRILIQKAYVPSSSHFSVAGLIFSLMKDQFSRLRFCFHLCKPAQTDSPA